MTLQISIDELLRYSSEERDKWRQWLVTHPAAMESPVQPAGGFPTIGKLIDHVFIVERRHLQRLQGQPLSSATGLTGNNVPPLFDYGASVRRELEQYLRDLGDEEADEVHQFNVRDRMGKLRPRERALLWLAYGVGQPHTEIADALGVKTGSVKLLLFRARRKLANLLGGSARHLSEGHDRDVR